jgi:hypothetical protein
MPYYSDFYHEYRYLKMTPEVKKAKKQLEEKYKAFGIGKIRMDEIVRNKLKKMFRY